MSVVTKRGFRAIRNALFLAACAPLALAATRGGDAAHALRTLDAGTKVTILLNAVDGDDENGLNPDYLVKTREGLIGWAHIPSKPDGTTIVEGLRFNGD